MMVQNRKFSSIRRVNGLTNSGAYLSMCNTKETTDKTNNMQEFSENYAE